MRQLRIVAALAVMAWTDASTAAPAPDRAAGRMIFESNCAGCHQPGNYSGKSAAELQSELKGMVAGTTSHPKKLTLSATAIANVAAYIVSPEAK